MRLMRLCKGVTAGMLVISLAGAVWTAERLWARPAATFTVNSTADAVDAAPGNGVCATSDGVCTLRAAVQESNALAGADTITLPAGTYALAIDMVNEDAGAGGDLDITDSLTINGAGVGSTIIDGADLDRLFHTLGSDATVINISGLTITNGTTIRIPYLFDYGSAIYHSAGTLNLTDVRIENSYTGFGGGIYNKGILTVVNSTITDMLASSNTAGIYNYDTGEVVIIDSTISNNISGYQGGGIYSRGKVTIDNSTISGNVATEGGGIYHVTKPITITNSVINNNQTRENYGGGGLYLGVLGATTGYIANTTVSGNTAYRDAGIYASGNLIVTYSTIDGNTATGYCGGVNFVSGIITMTHTIVSNNVVTGFQVGGGGAGICNSASTSIGNSAIHHNVVQWTGQTNSGGISISGDTTITNSTISHNEAGSGGGITYAFGNLTVENSTIYGNTAVTGGGFNISQNPGYIITFRNTVIANNNGGNCANVSMNISGGHNLDSEDSCGFTAPGDLTNADPLLGLLQNNGGFTPTHALLDGSPAIDAGDEIDCPATDQRGYLRPIDGDGNGVAVCDIGAFEYGSEGYSVFLPAIPYMTP